MFVFVSQWRILLIHIYFSFCTCTTKLNENPNFPLKSVRFSWKTPQKRRENSSPSSASCCSGRERRGRKEGEWEFPKLVQNGVKLSMNYSVIVKNYFLLEIKNSGTYGAFYWRPLEKNREIDNNSNNNYDFLPNFHPKRRLTGSTHPHRPWAPLKNKEKREFWDRIFTFPTAPARGNWGFSPQKFTLGFSGVETTPNSPIFVCRSPGNDGKRSGFGVILDELMSDGINEGQRQEGTHRVPPWRFLEPANLVNSPMDFPPSQLFPWGFPPVPLPFSPQIQARPPQPRNPGGLSPQILWN